MSDLEELRQRSYRLERQLLRVVAKNAKLEEEIAWLKAQQQSIAAQRVIRDAYAQRVLNGSPGDDTDDDDEDLVRELQDDDARHTIIAADQVGEINRMRAEGRRFTIYHP